jgi:hypothetical protein
MTISYSEMIKCKKITDFHSPSKKDGGKQMEEPKKPQPGEWENMQTEEIERKEQVKWEKPGDLHDLVFLCDHPKEIPSSDGEGVFYIFDVEEDNEERVVMTSAWSLLRGIKKHFPIKGKRLVISKEMIKGKQMFVVTDPDKPEVEEVQGD